jgi:hypothetical protein
VRTLAVVGNVASGIFGPEYSGASEEEIGTFDVEVLEPVDVIYKVTSDMKLNLLPPGGYVIRYVSGSYLLLNESPTKFVVGGSNGMQIKWSSSDARDWTSAPFAMYDEKDEPNFHASADLQDLSYVEFTKAHRLQLVPPENAVGSVVIRVIRYVPKGMIEWAVESMIEAAK